jgi:hypothetical protein
MSRLLSPLSSLPWRCEMVERTSSGVRGAGNHVQTTTRFIHHLEGRTDERTDGWTDGALGKLRVVSGGWTGLWRRRYIDENVMSQII